MRFASKFLTLLVSCVVLGGMTACGASAQEQTTQDQTQQGQQTDKDQQKKKKGGGFFSGLKAVSGSSSEQQEATRTAGSKTVGEGAQIGDAQPTAADRQAVSAMESYSLPAPDVKKFQDDGKLKSK